MIKTKNIKILSTAPIMAKGGVYGPILSPYTEQTSTIFAMISKGVNVVEVLKDGTEIKLTARNFDKDNDIKEEIPKSKPVVIQNVPIQSNKSTKSEQKEIKNLKPEIIPDVIEKK